MNLDEIVPKEKIEEIFELNFKAFGKVDNKEGLLAKALLKIACGYSNGSTVFFTLEHLGLSKRRKGETILSKKGKLYLYYYYQNKY